MKLKHLLIILPILSLTACSWCTEVEYVDRYNDVLVEVPCKIEHPSVDLNSSMNVSEKYVEILKYIANLHKEITACSSK